MLAVKSFLFEKKMIFDLRYCGPRISAQCVFHSNGELDFYFKKDLIDKKMTRSRHLFLFYFLKGKQNEKENPKCDSLFWKR